MGIHLHRLHYAALRFPLRAINHLFNYCASVLLTLKASNYMTNNRYFNLLTF